MKRLLKIILPLLVLLAGIGVFAALKATRPAQSVAVARERVWRVEVEPVEPASRAPYLVLYGRLESPSLFKASAAGAAEVKRVAVREGERVTRGQLLVALDRRDFVPRLDQARADVADLEAQVRSEAVRHASDQAALAQEQKLLRLARDGVQRARRLLKQKLGSESDVDDAERVQASQALAVETRERGIADHPPRLQALEARLQRARARVAELQLQLERSEVHAPYDAVIARVEVAEGDQVKDKAVLLSLYDPSALELRARIPAPYLEELQQALGGEAGLVGEAQAPTGQVRLRLARLSGEADPSGSDGLFRIETGAQGLWAGQLLRFRLQRLPRSDSVAVPYQAVYGGERIYILRDGRLHGLRVETFGGIAAAEGGERLLVRAEGLAAGDLLVTTHLPNAVEGLKAEVAGAD